jgi:hypothetical protein
MKASIVQIMFGAVLLFCSAATAMGAAAQGNAEEVAPPTFSVPGGVFAKNLKLELKANGAVIRFSTDGSEPRDNSPAYQQPIDISNCVLIRAKAWDKNGRASRTVSESYTMLGSDLGEFSSNLPLVIINTCGTEITAAEKSVTALRIMETKGGRTTLTSAADFSGLALLNLRGHSSLRYPKRSYSVKAVNESKEPMKVSILGMARDPDWVLYAPYPDKTLLRDVLAYDLNRQMGYWAPHTRFVEVFVNEGGGKLTMEHYAGVYVFEEKVTRGKSRVNVAKLDPNDSAEPELTGGYIFKKDHGSSRERKRLAADGPQPAAAPSDRTGYPTPPGGFPADPAGFLPAFGTSPRATTRAARTVRPVPQRVVTNYVSAAVSERVVIDDAELFLEEESLRTVLQRNQFYFHDPEPDEITGVQRAWLKDYVNRLEAALYGPDFMDPKKGYRAFIHTDSFIDYHLFSEVTKNVDAFRFSTFYQKDRGGLLKMGPVWDWNLSFGNADGKQGYMPQHWLWPQLNDQEYSWFRRLFEDPDFGQRYVDRWQELRKNVFSTSNVMVRIDSIVALLNESQERNFRRWEILGRDVSPNYFVGDTYQEEVHWMKTWTSNRLEWIEAQFPAAPVMKPGGKLEISTLSSAGRIYLTTDGRDPRSAGGKVSTAAQQYESPLALPKGAVVVARTLVDQRWSSPARYSAPATP